MYNVSGYKRLQSEGGACRDVRVKWEAWMGSRVSNSYGCTSAKKARGTLGKGCSPEVHTVKAKKECAVKG